MVLSWRVTITAIVHPGDDVTGEAQEVQDIAAALWTADVIAAYNASIAESDPA